MMALQLARVKGVLRGFIYRGAEFDPHASGQATK